MRRNDECLLNIRKLSTRTRKSFESPDFLAFRPYCEIDAGVEALAVDDDGAGTAFSYFTTLLDRGQVKIVSQHVRE